MPHTARRLAPLVVPIIWAAVLVAFIRSDALVAREEIPFAVGRLVYDEADFGALALRGANAYAGRLPGQQLEPPDRRWNPVPTRFEDTLDAPQPPLAPRFYLEYPTPALAFFWLGYAVQPGAATVPLPPTVADAHHLSVAFHTPRTDDERAVWGVLRGAVVFYVAVMAAALAGMMLLVGRGYEPGGGRAGPAWLLALPGAVFFALNRFDALPALMTALSFYCLGRGRLGWAGAWLGAGVALKLYPVLFVPVVLRYLGPRRPAVKWLAGFGAVGFVALAGSVALVGWEGTVGPIRVQMNRTLDIWTFYGTLLPKTLAYNANWRLAIVAVAILAACARPAPDLAGVLRRCALVLVVFVSLAVFWSPQWLLWFLPLLVPLAGRRWYFVGAVVALDVVNYLSFPVLFWLGSHYLPGETFRDLADGMIFVRAAVWLSIAGGLVWDEWASRRIHPAAAFDRAALRDAFLAISRAGGTPRGLTWVSTEPAGEPVFVTESASGQPVALLPVTVQFEPVPGSDMEDVPHARTPRPVTAVFAFDGRRWHPTGKAVFNLTPAEVIERSSGTFRRDGDTGGG